MHIVFVLRATVALHIGVDDIKAVCKDGRVVRLSYEVQELKDFFICQVHLVPRYIHHIFSIVCESLNGK